MPEQVTFEVGFNTTSPSLPPWTIRIYPIHTENSAAPSPWIATVTTAGITMQTNGVTQHVTWAALTRPKGDNHEA